MTSIWFLFYNGIVVPVLYVIFRLAGLFDHKIQQGIKDRKGYLQRLQKDLSELDQTKKLVWFHSASLGEFEQAKPIIEKLKSEYDVNVLVTFFSPSGYRNSLKYKFKDVISYLPFDSYFEVKKYLAVVKPALIVFMRYDFWPNIVWQLKRNNIPAYIVDATMRFDSKRKWPFSNQFHQSLFKNFDRILTVSESDAENFKFLGVKDEQLTAVGDTRFDRVYQKYLQAKELKLFRDGFFVNKQVLVVGSSWPSDEEVLLPAIRKRLLANNNFRVILVPHEPTVNRLEKIEENLNGKITNIRFSLLNNYNDEQVIIVDSIGILVSLYYYADVAYVGGSFKQGIHNVLEAAVYGVPVLFGIKINNSQEALELVRRGGGIKIQNSLEAEKHLNELLDDQKLRESTGKISYDYVNGNLGATEQIVKEISVLL